MPSSEAAPPSDNANLVTNKKCNRSSHTRKKSGKVSRKNQKAEREKLKRDHINVLFLDLGKTLEPTHQNPGKASILNDSIRLLRNLLEQIDCLKKENAALLSESHYVTIERDELQEENSGLEAQIAELQSGIEKRAHLNLSWNLGPSQEQCNNEPPQLEDQPVFHAIDHASQPGPALGPVFVVPLHQDPQENPRPDTADAVSKLPSSVSKPRARYPSPSDSWPLQILAETAETGNRYPAQQL
uniref:Transcription factor bHLH42 n=1 Tax=Nothapodytes nimmoniana TaxID=159386 RepID=A0A9E9C2J8_NOTNI|nr:transcription factor bHLH42 [Nothapodytes nimmoniana]